MDPRKVPPGVINIKTEPVSPTKTSSSGVLPLPIPIKKEAYSRLPSFRPPRDLSLSGSATSQSVMNINNFTMAGTKAGKRSYAPNINVKRNKGNSSGTNDATPQPDPKAKNIKEQGKKPLNNKKKPMNTLQTKGVFSEGLAPGKVKPRTEFEKKTSEQSVLEKPKLNLNQKINKKEEDKKLKILMTDNFIDDPDSMPDTTFIPTSLPIVYNFKTKPESSNLSDALENLQMKTEKVMPADVKTEANDILSIFEDSDSSKTLLFEFPAALADKEDSTEKKRTSKSQSVETDNKVKTKSGSLSNLGEGLWGCIEIHENGKAYFVIGTHTIPVVLTRHQPRQELMSTNIDKAKNKGEVINLGTIDATFTCSTNFFQGVS